MVPFAEQLRTAFNARDIDSFRTLLAEDARWESPDAPNTCHNRAEIIATFKRLLDDGVRASIVGHDHWPARRRLLAGSRMARRRGTLRPTGSASTRSMSSPMDWSQRSKDTTTRTPRSPQSQPEPRPRASMTIVACRACRCTRTRVLLAAFGAADMSAVTTESSIQTRRAVHDMVVAGSGSRSSSWACRASGPARGC